MADTKFEKTPTTTSSMPLSARKRDHHHQQQQPSPPSCECDSGKLKEVLDFGIVLAAIYGAFNLFRFVSDRVLASPQLLACLIAWLVYRFPTTAREAAQWTSVAKAGAAGAMTYLFLSPRLLLALRGNVSVDAALAQMGQWIAAVAAATEEENGTSIGSDSFLPVVTSALSGRATSSLASISTETDFPLAPITTAPEADPQPVSMASDFASPASAVDQNAAAAATAGALLLLPAWAVSLVGVGSFGTTVYLLAENFLRV